MIKEEKKSWNAKNYHQKLKSKRIKYLREKLIHSFILNQNGSKHDLLLKCNELLSEYGYSEIGLRTLEKHLKELKEKHAHPIESFIPTKEELLSKGYNSNIVDYPHRSVDVRKVRFLRYSQGFRPDDNIRPDEREKIDEAFVILSRFIGRPGWEWLDDVLDFSKSTLDLDPLIDQRISFEENHAGMRSYFSKIKDAMGNNTVLGIKRKVFRGTKHIIQDFCFHPSYLKLWKNKWYSFGVGEFEKKIIKPYVLPIDKHLIKIEYPRSKKFMKLDFNFSGEPIENYFFKDIIGVTNNVNSKTEKVIIRFHSKEKFRRIDTKPPHISWEVIKEGDDFIDVLMILKINPELKNFIYENYSGIEIIKPKSLRNQIEKDLKTALNYYTN